MSDNKTLIQTGAATGLTAVLVSLSNILFSDSAHINDIHAMAPFLSFVLTWIFSFVFYTSGGKPQGYKAAKVTLLDRKNDIEKDLQNTNFSQQVVDDLHLQLSEVNKSLTELARQKFN